VRTARFTTHLHTLSYSAGGKNMLVWPDQDSELQGAQVVGEAAVGRPLALKERGREGWRVGVVCDFDAGTGKHTVHFIPGPPPPPSSPATEAEDGTEEEEEEEEEEEHEVDLSAETIHWPPTETALCAKATARIASSSLSLSSSSSSSICRRSEGVGEDKTTLLWHTAEDIGTRLKVWWGKDQVYYSGTVTGFDPVADTHMVCYDDGDLRKYVMANKEYLILKRSSTAAQRQVAAPPAVAVAPAVAAAVVSQPAEEGATSTPSPSFPPSLYIHAKRPPASHHGVSYLLISNINLFLCLGGLRTLSRRLYHSFYTTHPPSLSPSFSSLCFYLTLLHLLRGRLEVDTLSEAVFHLKETVPSLVMVLEEEERNKLTKQDLRGLPQQLQVRNGGREGGREGGCFT